MKRQRLALAAGALLAGTAPAIFFSGGPIPFLSLYWVGLLLLLTAGCTFFPEKCFDETNSLDAALGFLLLMISLPVFFHGLSSVPVAFDEDMLAGLLLRKKDLLSVAAITLQPPLLVFQTWGAMHWGGVSALAIRVFPALAGALSVPMFYALLLRLRAGKTLAVLFALLLLTDKLFLGLAREARPYSFGVFFALVFLFELSGNGQAGFRARALRLTAANLLCLLSLGAQPILLTLAASAAYAAAFRRESLEVRGAPFLAFALAMLLFSPFQWFLAQNYPHYLSFSGFTAFTTVAPGVFRNIFWAAPILLIALLPFRASRKEPLSLVFLYLPFFALALFVLFLGAQKEWLWQTRYLLLLKLAFLIAIAVAAAKVALLKPIWRKGSLALCSALLLMSLINFRIPAAQETRWQELYRALEQANPQRARGFLFSAGKRETMGFSGFPAVDFYSTPELARGLDLPSLWDRELSYSQVDAILDAITAKLEPAEIFLFDQNLPGTRRLDNYRFSGTIALSEIPDIHDRPGLLLRLKNEGGLQKTFERFFLELEHQEKEEPLKYRVLQALAGLRSIEGKCSEAKAFLARAAAAPGTAHRNDGMASIEKRVEACSLRR